LEKTKTTKRHKTKDKGQKIKRKEERRKNKKKI